MKYIFQDFNKDEIINLEHLEETGDWEIAMWQQYQGGEGEYYFSFSHNFDNKYIFELGNYIGENFLPIKELERPVEPKDPFYDLDYGNLYDKPACYLTERNEFREKLGKYKIAAEEFWEEETTKEFVQKVANRIFTPRKFDIGSVSYVVQKGEGYLSVLTQNPEQEDEKHRNLKIATRVLSTVKMFNQYNPESKSLYEYGYIDSGSDTFGLGGNAWYIESLTERKVQVAGYHSTDTLKGDIPIGTGITVVDLPDGESLLLRAYESTILGKRANTLFSVPQMLENGVEVHDKSKRHGGMSYLNCDGHIIPLFLHEAMV